MTDYPDGSLYAAACDGEAMNELMAAGIPRFAVEIGKHRDPCNAVCHLEAWMNLFPGRRATVMFGGYRDDPREVWEIDRCVAICQAIIDSELLPRLDRRSAWFVYKTATGMPATMDDNYFMKFVDLIC